MTHSAPDAISGMHRSALLLSSTTALFKCMLNFFLNKMRIIYSENIMRFRNVSNQASYRKEIHFTTLTSFLTKISLLE